MLSNLPDKWDFEADIVAIGSGVGGLSAAITAHDLGSSAIVLERSEQVGGVTALSMGEVWVAGNHHAAAKGIEDSVESGYRYLKRLSMDYGSDLAILNIVAHAREALKYFEDKIGLRMAVISSCPDYYYTVTNDAVAEGRMLEVVPFPGETLGEWQPKTRLSPQMPYGLTHDDMLRGGGVCNMMKWDFALMGERLTRDERCLGPGLAAYFVKGALDRGIPLMTGANAEELIADGSRVVGVRFTQGGKTLYAKANKGVVVAVSSYEQNQNLNKTLSRQLEQGTMLFSGINGANFRLAGPLGARIASVPDITSLGMTIPGEEDEEGQQLWRSALPVIGQPHTIVVNRAGKRFGNESFYRSFYYMIDVIDGATPDPSQFPLLGGDRQPGAGEIPLRLADPRHGLARRLRREGRYAGRAGATRSASMPRRSKQPSPRSTPMPKRAKTPSSGAAPSRGACGCAAIRSTSPTAILDPW